MYRSRSGCWLRKTNCMLVFHVERSDLELEGCTSVWKSNTELGYLNAIEQMWLWGGRRVDGVGGRKLISTWGVHSNRSSGRPPRSRGDSWEHESVASSHVEDTVSRLEEDVYRRRAASVERRRSARLSAEAERRSKKCTRFSTRRSRALSCSIESQGRRESREEEGGPRRQREMNARPKVLDRPAPDFGARGARVTTPRGNRAPSPRRTPRRSPSPGGRRAPSPSMRQRARRRRRRLLKARRRRALPWRGALSQIGVRAVAERDGGEARGALVPLCLPDKLPYQSCSRAGGRPGATRLDDAEQGSTDYPTTATRATGAGRGIGDRERLLDGARRRRRRRGAETTS